MKKRYLLLAVILALVALLIPLALHFRQAGDGIQRFHDFIEKNPSFSVDMSVTSSHVRVPGKGTFLVKRPDSFRLTMSWAPLDYNYVKNAHESVEFESQSKTYQQFPADPDLTFSETVLSEVQLDSLPLPLLVGDLKRFGGGQPFKLTGTAAGSQTYTATWKGPQGSGTSVASIDSEGKLLAFDFTERTMNGEIHRVEKFSNYVMNPPIRSGAFDTTPPVGFTTFNFPYPEPTLAIGDTLNLGSWRSSGGSVDLDGSAKGALLVVRSPDSPPADALMAYLAKHPAPVKTIELSLGAAGGEFHSPSTKVADKLATMGTPLMILLDSENKIRAMWLGFDAEKPLDVAGAVSEALKRKQD